MLVDYNVGGRFTCRECKAALEISPVYAWAIFLLSFILAYSVAYFIGARHVKLWLVGAALLLPSMYG